MTTVSESPSGPSEWLPPPPADSSKRWRPSVPIIVSVAAVLVVAIIAGAVTAPASKAKPKAAHHNNVAASSGNTGNTGNGQSALLTSAASAYQTDFQQFVSVFNTPNTATGNASADITKQQERIQNDSTTVSNGAGADSCNLNDSNYESCLSQAQQTENNAESDETAAQTAENNDVSQEETDDQQIATAMSTFVQQLDSITWPTVAVTAASDLAQDLSNERNDYSQEATDLADSQPLSADNDAVTADSSAVTTQEINLATALQIPPPSS